MLRSCTVAALKRSTPTTWRQHVPTLRRPPWPHQSLGNLSFHSRTYTFVLARSLRQQRAWMLLWPACRRRRRKERRWTPFAPRLGRCYQFCHKDVQWTFAIRQVRSRTFPGRHPRQCHWKNPEQQQQLRSTLQITHAARALASWKHAIWSALPSRRPLHLTPRLLPC